LTLEIGFQLIPFVDASNGGQMLNRVRALRRHLATELGFVVPSVHITDNLRLRPREYVISLRGIEIGRWQTEGNCLLAVTAGPDREGRAKALPGIETKEPAFGVNAKWIDPSLQERALAAGCSVVDQTTVIGTHLGELIRRHAHELLSRGEVKRLMDGLTESHPKLVEELVPKLMTLGEVSTSALPVLLCPSPARYHVRRWLEPILPRVTVLSPVEIPAEVRVQSVGQIG
ncbi:FHIPEP family type III secretion protein, partial [Terriglobus sp. YAF25]|uniref:FHIPEP family type III secretion protein n=1 Tax=Terriglobus sp. YAF25 TaxID=3233080 RepID=UPI003F94C38E